MEIIPEWCFLIFWIFMLFFFLNFNAEVGWEWISGLNFFFLFFSAYLILVSIQIMQEWCFLIFVIFLIFFLEFSSPGRVEQNSGLKLFSLFLGLSHPVLDRNNAEKMFLIFWIFLLFLLEFSCSVRVGTDFGTKIVFSPSRSMSSRFV